MSRTCRCMCAGVCACLYSGANTIKTIRRKRSSWKFQFMWKNRNSRFYRLKRMRMTYATVDTLGETVKVPCFIRLLHFHRNGFCTSGTWLILNADGDGDTVAAYIRCCYDLNAPYHTMLRCVCALTMMAYDTVYRLCNSFQWFVTY